VSTGSWWVNRREGDHWGDLGVDTWILLGWILVGKPEGRRPLWRRRRRWVDNIRMDLGGVPEGRRPVGRPRCRWVDNIRTDLGGETGGKETTGET